MAGRPLLNAQESGSRTTEFWYRRCSPVVYGSDTIFRHTLPERPAVSIALVLALAAAPVALLWLLPLAADVAGVLHLLRRRKSVATGQPERNEQRTQLLFLVPAHNESLLIEACVRSLVAM